MLTRNIICSIVLAAFVYGLGWTLTRLSNVMELSSFMIFCIVTFALMVAGAFTYDYLSRVAASSDGQSAARHDYDWDA